MNKHVSIIGAHVKYFDFLGEMHYGSIIAVEPSPNPEEPYLYISDEDEEFNTHEDLVNGTMIRYAEIRISSEVCLDN